MAKFEIESIGRVEAARKEALDDDWGGTEAAIVLDPRFEEDALAGLETFSHVEVLFVFDRVDPGATSRSADRRFRAGGELHRTEAW